MKKLALFLADGFEEIEGLTVVDLMRRTDIEITTVSVMERLEITSAHNIKLYADAMFEDIDLTTYDGVVLPGGMPGTTHLMNHAGVNQVIREFDQQQKLVAAICAAPSVLGEAGLLDGKSATVYPGFEEHLKGAKLQERQVTVDGHIITAPGVGKVFEFCFEIIKYFLGEQKAQDIKDEIIF